VRFCWFVEPGQERKGGKKPGSFHLPPTRVKPGEMDHDGKGRKKEKKGKGKKTPWSTYGKEGEKKRKGGKKKGGGKPRW